MEDGRPRPSFFLSSSISLPHQRGARVYIVPIRAAISSLFHPASVRADEKPTGLLLAPHSTPSGSRSRYRAGGRYSPPPAGTGRGFPPLRGKLPLIHEYVFWAQPGHEWGP